MDEGGVAVVGAGEVGGIEGDGLAVDVGDGEGNFEWRYGGDGAVEVDDGLGEAGDLGCGVGVEAIGSGVGGEVEVEGAILLEEDEDVLDVLAEELEFSVVGEAGFGGGREGEALDGGAGGWGNVCLRCAVQSAGTSAKNARSRTDCILKKSPRAETIC